MRAVVSAAFGIPGAGATVSKDGELWRAPQSADDGVPFTEHATAQWQIRSPARPAWGPSMWHGQCLFGTLASDGLLPLLPGAKACPRFHVTHACCLQVADEDGQRRPWRFGSDCALPTAIPLTAMATPTCVVATHHTPVQERVLATIGQPARAPSRNIRARRCGDRGGLPVAQRRLARHVTAKPDNRRKPRVPKFLRPRGM